MASALISDDCPSVADANGLFAQEKGLLVLRPGSGCCNFWFTIPSGCYALVTTHGADTDFEYDSVVSSGGQRDYAEVDKENKIVPWPAGPSAVWPAGLHFPFPPWVAVSHLVTKQTIVLDMPVKACKTHDNVTVNIDVALAFRIMGDQSLGEDPELVRKFVHQLSPRGLEQQLRDAQEEAVRGLARSLKHTEIYGIRSGGASEEELKKRKMKMMRESNDDTSVSSDDSDGDDMFDRDETFEGSHDIRAKISASRAMNMGKDVTEKMKKELNNQFVPQGVQITSVMIMTVTLPDDICEQMSDKTMIISANAQQRMEHQNSMQNTRMNEQIQTMLQSFAEQREQMVTSGNEKENSEQVLLNDAIALAEKAELNIKEANDVNMQNIIADNKLLVQRVRDETHGAITKITVESEKESEELVANTNLEVQTLISESELIAAQNRAKADLIIAEAEGTIAPLMVKKREFITHEKKLDVYSKLGSNKDLIVTGKSGIDDDVNLVAVADAILQGQDGSAKSALLAEMALMSQGSSAFAIHQRVDASTAATAQRMGVFS